jgi:hypothetical protein
MAQPPTPGRRGRPSRASVHERLAFEVGELRARLGGLPLPAEAEDIWTAIWYQEAHNSTALEGNTLVMREVEALLREKRVVGKKQLRDYMEVRGYADAAHWIYSQAVAPGDWGSEALLTVTEVREAHRRAVTPAWEVAPPEEAMSRKHLAIGASTTSSPSLAGCGRPTTQNCRRS